ncbi:type II secretion system protein GspG [Kamptonema cortianum]|nr:type II secretion system protein GspG [Kamptonema cortianum]MDL5044536.1 type II secretion system protein GspG [Oscillatoria amoena NRMC-F 0135]
MKTNKNPLSSFTLIEILAVIAVIIILAGITLGIIGYANSKALRDRTTAEIKFIELQMERYHNDVGEYPEREETENNGLFKMLGQTNDFIRVRPLAEFKPSQVSGDNLVDPYGNLYGFKSPGFVNKGGFDLWSTAGAGSPTSTNNLAAYRSVTNNPNSTNIARWLGNWRR